MKSALGALALALAPLLSLAAPGQGHMGQMDHTNMNMAGMNHGPADIGQPAKNPTRDIQIDMGDNMRFTPERIRVKPGETVRFVVKNSGQIRHEFVLGTPADLQAHYQMMLQQPDMPHHGMGNSVSLEAGQTGELIWRFPKQGDVGFGCLDPGHSPAGMQGKVVVE
ncbi:cupredoxin domain-containing protein [Bordetella pseudohinzii]|uniref:cupredoxin domain-containing protein n=1 Tax=Bordetella pseudohinzii TaxID=1331258 RepID=UPI00194030A1|nr:cupredoxin family protein [Bordetella pseudohinzii]